MGIDDLMDQGKKFMAENSEKLQELVDNDQAEGVIDQVLDAGADFAKKVAPDQFDSRVDDVRDTLDGALGRH